MDGESWGLSLSQFTQLSPVEQVLLLVPEGESASDAAAAAAHRVAKLIAVSVQPEGRQQLLVGLVQEDAPRHLPWCVHIFERLRLQRQVRVSTLLPHPSPPCCTPLQPTPFPSACCLNPPPPAGLPVPDPALRDLVSLYMLRTGDQ